MEQEINYKESWIRSLAKAVGYRIAIIALDFGAVYLFTKRVDIAAGFVVVSNIYTTVAYFVHERIWNSVSWGKEKI